MVNYNVNKFVLNFIHLLRVFKSQCDVVYTDCDNPEYIDDWMQANWELLVELPLQDNIFLEVYSAGSDLNGTSSRILFPHAKATHRVCCISNKKIYDHLNNEYIDLSQNPIPIEKFVEMKDGWFYENSLFDMVLLSGNETRVVKVSEVDFVLVQIKDFPLSARGK